MNSKIVKNTLALIASITACLFFSSSALAQTADQDLPIYSLVLIGNFNTEVKTSIQKINADLTFTGGKFTVGNNVLINTDEKSVSSDGETTGEIDDLSLEFSTANFKGVVLRIFPAESNKGSLEIKVNDSKLVIPVSKLRNEKTDFTVDNNTEIKVIPLQTDRFTSNLETEKNFAPKLQIIKTLFATEKWLSEQFLTGKIEAIVLKNWRQVLWKALDRNYNSEEAAWFIRKFNMTKKGVNQGKTSARQLVNTINRLVIWNR